ncbi:hypothetical protein FNV68_08580 [Streptomyces sp. S1D4-23]|nr:hypothetical protein FNV61_07135 [Streptomyces sp. RLB3-6]QDO06297.1 hypothetical protein FNV68_08580 [Streptomyces sp. S1D4-23]
MRSPPDTALTSAAGFSEVPVTARGAWPGVQPGGDAGLLREILAAYRGTGSHLPPPEVVVGGSGEPIALLRDGRADVALLRSPFDGHGLDSQTLVVEPRLAVLPAAHRLAGRRRLRLTDLKGEPIPRWKGAAPSTTAYYTVHFLASDRSAYLTGTTARPTPGRPPSR